MSWGKPMKNVQNRIDELIALRAAQWYECLKDGADGDSAAFVEWIAESPRHMEAFLSVAGEAQAMRKVFASGAFDLDELLRDTGPQNRAAAGDARSAARERARRRAGDSNLSQNRKTVRVERSSRSERSRNTTTYANLGPSTSRLRRYAQGERRF
ncbi:MAG: DUF4880 domain-containing protein [Rudaea sp.]|uniref:hypothetical protein n=1 Tax=Rudaea sp. TaxID=2136325 RepID=UPI0039E31824